jgi:hypothetical protein
LHRAYQNQLAQNEYCIQYAVKRFSKAKPKSGNGMTQGLIMAAKPALKKAAPIKAMPSKSAAHPTLLEQQLKRQITGDVLFGTAARGRYATDASAYQIVPAGVVVPRTMDEAITAMGLARDHGISVTPRGGGTSQCGQTVNNGLVIDGSRHLTRVLELDTKAAIVRVEPGLVLDELNRQLKPHLHRLTRHDWRHGGQ